MNFLTREYIGENAINGNRSNERDKGVENYVDIIIAKTENIYQRQKLNEHIALKVIPPGVIRRKKTSVFIFIPAMENIEKVFRRVVEKQFIFIHA
jgi:hypothetical protein